MRVRFWGTRGSLATPEPTALRYGGNTPCVEVRAADGTLLVLDCGTGAYGLGQALVGAGGEPPRGHLLLTHTHWDHIQGFPFFAPLRVPGGEWDVYAPGGPGQRLRGVLGGQMEYEYFPVDLGQLAAAVRFHDLGEGGFDAGGVRVTACYLNHPALTLGYRLEAGGAVLVYATDHEPHGPLARPGAPPDSGGAAPGKLPLHHEDRRHVAFLAGADLVVHDAQYALEEYPARAGWGHSAAEHAVDLARAAGARRLALFHHDPLRDDAALDRLVEACRRRAGEGLEVFAAAEGPALELPERAGEPPPGPAPRSAFLDDAGEAAAEQTVLVVTDEPGLARRLGLFLRPEGLRLLTAGGPGSPGGPASGAPVLGLARAARPDLVVLDARADRRAALDLCRALRAEEAAALRRAPVVVLVAPRPPEHEAAAVLAAGATDFLPEPVTPALVRAAVRRWLLRAGAALPPP
jgi:phosphoribosyl 1,2-cyclic phosphodiesterase/CheY-like chemotaxis protein